MICVRLLLRVFDLFSAGQGERLYAMKSIHVARLHKLRVEEFENEVRWDVHSSSGCGSMELRVAAK